MAGDTQTEQWREDKWTLLELELLGVTTDSYEVFYFPARRPYEAKNPRISGDKWWYENGGKHTPWSVMTALLSTSVRTIWGGGDFVVPPPLRRQK